jgi:hypothetical protein
MESSLSQTVFHEGLLSELFGCLSGRKIVVVETMMCSPISIDESWSFVSLAPVVEVGFSYTASDSAGELALNEAGLALISERIGIRARKTPGFTLLRPMHQRLYRVYEDHDSRSLDQLGDVQIAVSGRESKSLYGRYNNPMLMKWMRVKVGITAKVDHLLGDVDRGKRIPCSVFLEFNNKNMMEVKMDASGESLSLEAIKSVDLDDEVHLEVSLGAIRISLEELLRLREGSKITIQIRKTLRGYLGLGADSFAEVELHFGDDVMAIEVMNVLL